jgi:hypothetical protein
MNARDLIVKRQVNFAAFAPSDAQNALITNIRLIEALSPAVQRSAHECD